MWSTVVVIDLTPFLTDCAPATHQTATSTQVRIPKLDTLVSYFVLKFSKITYTGIVLLWKILKWASRHLAKMHCGG